MFSAVTVLKSKPKPAFLSKTWTETETENSARPSFIDFSLWKIAKPKPNRKHGLFYK